jgi:hypothetical protein
MALEALRTRFLYRSLDAVMTVPLRCRKGPFAYLGSLLSPGSSNYDRVAALVGLIDTLIPGTGRRASEFLFRAGSIPFPGEPLELMASGSGSTVFLLDTGQGRKVVKAYRRTIGRSGDGLRGLATVYKAKYDTVSSWYAGPYDIVLPASFLLLHSPLLGRPAVACVQPYVEGEKRDFFADFDDAELLRLMKEDDGLREQFAFFARRTLKIRDAQRLCTDLLGTQNLMITREGKSWALKLIDYGIFDLRSLEDESAAVCSGIAKLFSRLQSLLSAVSPISEDSVPGRLSD